VIQVGSDKIVHLAAEACLSGMIMTERCVGSGCVSHPFVTSCQCRRTNFQDQVSAPQLLARGLSSDLPFRHTCLRTQRHSVFAPLQ